MTSENTIEEIRSRVSINTDVQFAFSNGETIGLYKGPTGIAVAYRFCSTRRTTSKKARRGFKDGGAERLARSEFLAIDLMSSDVTEVAIVCRARRYERVLRSYAEFLDAFTLETPARPHAPAVLK